MPGKRPIEKAREDKQEGKAPTTQAGEFIREGMHKIRLGEHGARSPKQAIAVGLSEAQRSGVDLPLPACSTMAHVTLGEAIRPGGSVLDRPQMGGTATWVPYRLQ